MTITAHEVIAYENLVDRVGTTLSSSDVEATSSIDNLADPNLSALTDFGTGTSKAFKADAGASVEDMSKFACYLRFRGTGWSDITSVRLEVSPNSDLSSPIYDTTHSTTQFPTTWRNDIPRRPIFRLVADIGAGTKRYWRVTVARTAGSADLEIARCYLGAAHQFDTAPGNGVVLLSSQIGVEEQSEEQLADNDGDTRYVRSGRRTASLKLRGMSDTVFQDNWYGRFLLAAAGRDVLFVKHPTETDPARIQNGTIWGGFRADKATYAGSWWEQGVEIKERL